MPFIPAIEKEIQDIKSAAVPSEPVFRVGLSIWGTCIEFTPETKATLGNNDSKWYSVVKDAMKERIGHDGRNYITFDNELINRKIKEEVESTILMFLAEHIQAKNTRLTTLFQWWKDNIGMMFQPNTCVPKNKQFAEHLYKVYLYLEKHRSDITRGSKHSVNTVALLNLIKNKYK